MPLQFWVRLGALKPILRREPKLDGPPHANRVPAAPLAKSWGFAAEPHKLRTRIQPTIRVFLYRGGHGTSA